MIIDSETPGAAGLDVFLDDQLLDHVCSVDTDNATVVVELYGADKSRPLIDFFTSKIRSMRLTGGVRLEWKPGYQATPQIDPLVGRYWIPPDKQGVYPLPNGHRKLDYRAREVDPVGDMLRNHPNLQPTQSSPASDNQWE